MRTCGNYHPEQVSGGTVSYELGQSAHDSIEMRDGTVLTGDVQSVSPTEVVIIIGVMKFCKVSG